MDAEYDEVDEELPPITVNELVSIDEILNDNPSFVAIEDEYLEAYAGELLANSRKGQEFLRLHKRCMRPPQLSSIDNCMFEVAAIRRNVVDDTEYFTNWKELYDTAPYKKYNSDMSRISAPYEKDEDATTDTTRPILSIDSRILLSDKDNGILFKNDITPLPIKDIVFKPSVFTNESYVFETSDTRSQAIKIGIPSGDVSLEQYISENKPKIKDIDLGNELYDVTDMHTIRSLVAMYNYSFDNLKQSDIDELAERLNEIELQVSEQRQVKSHTIKKNGEQERVHFEDAVATYYDRVDAYMTDTRKETLRVKFDAYLSAHPQFNMMQGIDPPFQLAMSLIHGSQDLPTVLQTIRDIRNGVNTKLVRELLVALQSYKQDKEALIRLRSIHLQDPKKDHVVLLEIGTTSEIHEVVKGLDTSLYEGVDNSHVFVELDTSFDDFQIDQAPYVVQFDLPLPDNLRSPEHMAEPFKDIRQLVEISGLPWNFDKWLSEAFRDIPFVSRFEALKKVTPDISEFVLQRIATATTPEDGLKVINQMSNRTEAAKLEGTYPQIYREWFDLRRYVFIDGLSFWAIDTLETSLSGALDFKLPHNQYAHYWSAYGPPVETQRSRGVIPYIAHIANTDIETIINHAEGHYSTKLERIKGMRVKPDVDDTVQQAFIDALAHHKENKIKHVEFFMKTFIPMYLHMPSNIVQKVPLKKQPPWAQGCCIVPLDKTYEADVDFKYNDKGRKKVTSLYAIKSKFTDKRWLKTPRPSMLVVVVQGHKKPDHSKDAIYIPQMLPIDVTITDTETQTDMNKVSEALKDIASETHINDYIQGRTTVFKANTEAAGVATGVTGLNELLKADLHLTMYVTAIKRIVASQKSIELLEIKKRLYHGIPKEIVQYLLVVLIQRITLPIPDEITDIFKSILSVSKEYTFEDAKEYINKKREESKKLTLRKTDVLEREDRELAKYANELGVAKYADLPLPPDAPAGAAENAANAANAEEENDFVQPSADEEGDREDYYK